MVLPFLLACLRRASLTTFSLKVYELATGCWLFNSEVVGDIYRDIIHPAQITQRIGQDYDDAVLKRYEARGKQGNLKGKETHSNVFLPIYLRRLQAC